jgi:hypothetical protein
MKITPENTEMNVSRKNDSQSAGIKLGLAGSDGLVVDESSNSFASVLDRVTRSHNNSRSEDGKSSAASSDTRETKKTDDDNGVDEVSLANVERTVAREPVAVTEVSSDNRPVLHNVDLNSIVTACHVQLSGGQHEVTLELSRSMLEGLRVKLTSDGAGRITADFLAATEGVKALLDGRSQELIDQLRARGINLAEFRSSVSADTNSRNDSQERQPAPRTSGAIESVSSTQETEPTNAEESIAAGATYRA